MGFKIYTRPFIVLNGFCSFDQSSSFKMISKNNLIWGIYWTGNMAVFNNMYRKQIGIYIHLNLALKFKVFHKILKMSSSLIYYGSDFVTCI